MGSRRTEKAPQIAPEGHSLVTSGRWSDHRDQTLHPFTFAGRKPVHRRLCPLRPPAAKHEHTARPRIEDEPRSGPSLKICEPSATIKAVGGNGREIGPFATPDVLQFAPGLPKTRSGKIMRRILRKIAEDDLSNLGDTSTLADPLVVDDLVQNRGARRGDDAIVSGGHRLWASEIEATLVRHEAVFEAVVVGVSHKTKGEAVWCYVRAHEDVSVTDVLAADLKGFLRREMGAHAVPEVVQFAADLPRTPSGEVVRAMLRQIAEGDAANLGDTTGLRDPSVIIALVKARAQALA